MVPGLTLLPAWMMSGIPLGLPTLTLLLAAGWFWHAICSFLFLPRIPNLLHVENREDFPLAATGNPNGVAQPDLTVIVPACNEQETIASTLGSLLASTGLRLQIVAVDDRSTDATGAIMDRVAAEYTAGFQTGGETRGGARPHLLEILHIRELPPGWLGKTHALALAAARAQADWLLFTDGDVQFAPQALALALRHAVAERADHLILLPTWLRGSFGEGIMQGAINALSVWVLHLWNVAKPGHRAYFGVGAFNLVRCRVYRELGGFEALPMEVLEDLRFGWKIKRGGYAQRVALGPGLVSLRWCHGAWGVVRNIEKNGFALYRYRTLLMLPACAGLACHIALPLVALILGGGLARWAALLAFLGIALVILANRPVSRAPWWSIPFFPFAAGLFLFGLLRSMALALARGGVVWRGRLYSLKDLRRHAGPMW